MSAESKQAEYGEFCFVFPKIDLNTLRWRSGVKEWFFYELEMNGAHCGWPSVGNMDGRCSPEYHVAIPNFKVLSQR